MLQVIYRSENYGPTVSSVIFYWEGIMQLFFKSSRPAIIFLTLQQQGTSRVSKASRK